MNKAFWSHFKHFGRPDLLESFPANESPDITGQFGCGHRAKFSPSVGGKGGGGGGNLTNSTYQLFETPKNQSAQTRWIVYFPPKILPFKDILFFPNLPVSELPEEQIF